MEVGGLAPNLTLVASNDDYGTDTVSKLTFTATAGAVYHIAVDGWGGAEGDIRLTVFQLAPGGTTPPLTLVAQPLAGGVRLLFRHNDGMLPSDLSKVQVLWRNTLPSGSDTNWQIVSAGFYVANGYVVFDDLTAEGEPHRFYRVREQVP